MDDQELDELLVQERRAYQKEWRAKNKDKVRQHNRNFWLKRATVRRAEQQRNNDDDSEN